MKKLKRKYDTKILSLDDVSDALIYKEPKNKFERYINACSIIPKIVSIYNEGEVLDWTNTKQSKYVPYRYLSGGVWLVGSVSWTTDRSCPGGCYFKRKEDSDDALAKFRTIYDDFWNG